MDRISSTNKPDVVVKNLKDKTFLITAVATQTDRNAVKNKAETKFKYKDLSTEIRRIWGKEVTVIPVIIGALETSSKGLQGHAYHLTECHLIPDIQKTVGIGL